MITETNITHIIVIHKFLFADYNVENLQPCKNLEDEKLFRVLTS
jgi:hypothetical protein